MCRYSKYFNIFFYFLSNGWLKGNFICSMLCTFAWLFNLPLGKNGNILHFVSADILNIFYSRPTRQKVPLVTFHVWNQLTLSEKRCNALESEFRIAELKYIFIKPIYIRKDNGLTILVTGSTISDVDVLYCVCIYMYMCHTKRFD